MLMEFDWKRLIGALVISEPTICVPQDMEHLAQFVLAVYVPGVYAYRRVTLEVIQSIRSDIRREKDREISYTTTRYPKSERFLIPYLPWSSSRQARWITEDYVRVLFLRHARLELSILRIPIGLWREVVRLEPVLQSEVAECFGPGLRIVRSNGGPL